MKTSAKTAAVTVDSVFSNVTEVGNLIGQTLDYLKLPEVDFSISNINGHCVWIADRDGRWGFVLSTPNLINPDVEKGSKLLLCNYRNQTLRVIGSRGGHVLSDVELTKLLHGVDAFTESDRDYFNAWTKPQVA